MDSHNLFNTISDSTDISGGQNTNVQQNVGVTSPITPSEGLQPQTSADSEAQQPFADDDDAQMDYDDLPHLQEVSDSSDDDAESESDRDANEVEMQAVDHNDDEDEAPSLIDIDIPHEGPSSSSAPSPSLYSPAARPNSNRRARVEDDQDEERDRRHPSQRVSSNNRNNSFATSSSSQTGANSLQVQTPAPATPSPHIHRHIIHASFNVAGNLDPNNNVNALRLFQHLMSPVNTNNNAAPNQNNNPNAPRNENPEGGVPQPIPPQQQQQPQQPGNNDPHIGGVALSFEIGPGFPLPQGGGPQANPPPGEQGAPDVNAQHFPPRTGPLADILGLLGRLGGGLDGETVINFGNMGLGLGMHQEKDDPERAKKLVAGLEVVPVGLVRRLERVGGPGGGMGEEPTNGGDAGCAICWDKLLDGDGEGFGKEKTEGSPEAGSSSDSETLQPKIVSLPCAHVFHADCLLPWFARPRHTTCPTCRFNIDPENLTHASMRRRERRERAAARRAEDPVNAADGHAPPEDGLEAAGNDMDGDGPRLPAILELLGASGELATPQEVDLQNRQMIELMRIRNANAAPPPQPPGLLGRLGTARAHSAPPESHANSSNEPAAAEANAAPPSAAETSTATAPHPTPFAPTAAGTLPRTPNVLRTPQGAIGILPFPIPVMIPIHIPASAHVAAGNPAAAPHTPQQNAFVVQPRTEGDFGHLLSRMMRDIRQPVPFNSLFPGLTLNRQQPPQPQSTQAIPQPATPGNVSVGGSMPGNYLRNHRPSGMVTYRPRTPIPVLRSSYLGPQFLGTHAVDPLNAQNFPRMTPQPQTPHINPANSAPGGQAAPQDGNGNPPNMPRRDAVEIRVDMIFGPGPGAFPFPTGNHQGAAAQRGGQAPNQEETDAFMQQLENDILQHAQAHGAPTGNANDALRREIEGRLFELLGRRHRANGEPAPAGQQTPGRQQPGQPTAAMPPPAQQPTPPFGDVNPAFLAGLNTGMNMHFTGTGRSIAEAFSQILTGVRAQQQQQQPGQDAPAVQPQPEGEPQQPAQPATEAAPQALPQQQQIPPAGNVPPGFNPFGMFPNLADIFDGGLPEGRAPRPRKDWTLPPAPGPTLRQRIERREREAGLRCYDVSCGIGPSDEDPYGTELEGDVAGMKQLSIMSKEDKSELCSHTFHGPCLVTAERVALRGADANVEDGNVEVSCPVCRGAGCVSKADWDDGVVALL